MAGLSFFELMLVLPISVVGAVAIILLTQVIYRRAAEARPTPSGDTATLLFDGASLIDATPMARGLLDSGDPLASEYERATTALASVFPGLLEALHTIDRTQTATLPNVSDPDLVLEIESWDGIVRLTLRELSPKSSGDVHGRLLLHGLQEENELLRSIAFDAPQLIWMTDPQGETVWANQAYLNFADNQTEPSQSPHAAPGWPPAPVFAGPELLGHIDPDGVRLSAKNAATGEKKWFTVYRVNRNTGTMFVAESADALVRAEIARRNFVQTLTKTFAQLSTGLAIFDKDRRLVLFNPALVDLIGLPVEFLITQPSLATVLDRMREERMLPERRDFGDWRNRLLNIEAAAQEGTYCENWSLLNDCTYRMTGRPHPDGALAFLIEDISEDLSLTRQYRSEIALGQSVIDSFEEAVAVFTGTGVMTLTNSAFGALWGFSDEDQIEELTLQTALRKWAASSQPSPFWEELQAFIGTDGPRQKWDETILMNDGRVLLCRVSPLAGGGTICMFHKKAEAARDASFSTVRRLSLAKDAIAS